MFVFPTFSKVNACMKITSNCVGHGLAWQCKRKYG